MFSSDSRPQAQTACPAVWHFSVMALGFLLATCDVGLADELELTSGTVIKGRLVEQNATEVTFEKISGAGKAVLKYPKHLVKDVRVDGKVPVEEPAPTPAATPSPKPVPMPTPTPKIEPPTAPSEPAKGDLKSKAEVEALIEAAGKADPEWLESTKLEYPDTLNLKWEASGQKGWHPDKDLGPHLVTTIGSTPSNYQKGIKLLHHVVSVNKDDAAKLARSYDSLGRHYLLLVNDYARAAYYLRKGGQNDVDTQINLAVCYWKLGSKSMAGEILAKFPADTTRRCWIIKLYGEMGELDKALKMAEAAAKGNADMAYLAAGDACRFAGDIKKAITYYTKAVTATSAKADSDRNKHMAADALAAMKAVENLDLSKVKDGTYSGKASGYIGEVAVEVQIASGKIESVKVTQHKENLCYTAPTDVARAIGEKQGFKGVDTVTCATISSNTVINATALALGAASGAKVDPPKPTGKYKDGVYQGTGRGHKSDITLSITIKNGKITNVGLVKQADDRKWWDRCWPAIPTKIIQMQGTEGVDTITRATRSSRGILGAAKDALDKAANTPAE